MSIAPCTEQFVCKLRIRSTLFCKLLYLCLYLARIANPVPELSFRPWKRTAINDAEIVSNVRQVLSPSK